ncbi:hypothetical protein LXJ58_34620, partial [Escherichia coli]|nr:hypothetical protein [Escherichia coli]
MNLSNENNDEKLSPEALKNLGSYTSLLSTEIAALNKLMENPSLRGYVAARAIGAVAIVIDFEQYRAAQYSVFGSVALTASQYAASATAAVGIGAITAALDASAMLSGVGA